MRSKKAVPGIDYVGVGVVFWCHDGKGKVVLHKRSQNCRDNRGRWDCGGGALEVSESLQEAVRREVLEEYCVLPRKIEPLGFREVHQLDDGKNTHWLAFDFKVLVNKGKVRIGEPKKVDALGWFTLKTLPKPLHLQFPEFFRKYKGKL